MIFKIRYKKIDFSKFSGCFGLTTTKIYNAYAPIPTPFEQCRYKNWYFLGDFPHTLCNVPLKYKLPILH